ncbi:MAG: porin family protein [Bacteroidota bacterium]
MAKLFIYFTGMHNYLTLVLLLVGVHFASAQTKLGLKFSPSASLNRISNQSDTLDFSDDGAAIRFLFGLTADVPISDTYSFSTGVIYTPKHVSFAAVGENGGSYLIDLEEYRLHYLMIPISLKLYTNEIQPDAKLYFQVGATGEVKIFDEPKDERFIGIEDFNLFNASVLLGAGLEYKVGLNTILTAGFSYYRGLLNAIDQTIPIDDELIIKNDMISFDVGVKF